MFKPIDLDEAIERLIEKLQGGGLPGGAGESINRQMQELRSSLVSVAPEMGTEIAEGIRGNLVGVGENIAQEIKDNLAGTDIRIQAQMGPVQVQLTDGSNALQNLTTQTVAAVSNGLSTFFTKLFNNDSSLKTGDINAGINPSNIQNIA